MPDTEVKEARDRVRAAILNSGFEFPIDVQIEVPAVPSEGMSQMVNSDKREQIRSRVVAAQLIQTQRQGKLNSALSSAEIDQFCPYSQHPSNYFGKSWSHWTYRPVPSIVF